MPQLDLSAQDNWIPSFLWREKRIERIRTARAWLGDERGYRFRIFIGVTILLSLPGLLFSTFGCLLLIYAGPSLVSMAIGNAICKALDLPSFPSFKPLVDIVIHGTGGMAFLFPLVLVTGYLCFFVDSLFERRYKQFGGRLDPYSFDTPASSRPSREDGYFPTIVFWMVFCFSSTYIVASSGYGEISTLIQQGELGKDNLVLKLTREETLRLVNLGSLIGAPAFPIITPLTFLCLFFVVNSMWDVLIGEPQGDVCVDVLRWYGRQYEASCWLFQPNVSPHSAERYVSLEENTNGRGHSM